jgi:hypothetical protein
MSMTVVDSLRALDLFPGASQKGGTMRRPQGLQTVRLAIALSAALSLAGCAAVQQTVGGWFGAATPTPTPQAAPGAAGQVPRVYYAGVEGVKVYGQPSTSSKVVGALSLHEKVTRTKLERGYAYVESSKSGVKGWVNNAQLIWRLPTAATTAEPAPAEEQPEEPVAPTGEETEVPEPTATAAEPAPTATQVPEAPPTVKGTPRGVAPSIFNPY